MNHRRFSLFFLAGALLLALALGVTAHALTRAQRFQARLKEVYDGAALSTLRQLEDMQLSLTKALLSGQSGPEAQYLNQVSAGAAQVQRSLSLLPLSHTATQSAMKLANQAADYAQALLRQEALTEDDAARLNSLIAACGDAAAALAQGRESLSALAAAGQEPFYPAQAEGKNDFDSAVAYPTLIYDGPFSDAKETGPARGLPDRPVTKAEAVGIAREFIGADRVLSAEEGPEIGGSIPCWGVSLRLADITLQAAVTRQGGKILWLFPDTADFTPGKTVAECRENARQFLSLRGFENMTPTYFQAYQGVAVISFAATQGAAVLYPDLVKVQCRMDTGQVVGLEARSYWQNHGPRGLLSPRLTAEEAQRSVSPRLSVDSSRLCLIPTDGGERLCYEFQAQFGGQTYLAYINAENGRQEQLLQVMENAAGLEAV